MKKILRYISGNPYSQFLGGKEVSTRDITVIRRGDLFYANLSVNIGSEQGGIRPVLVIQNDIGNRYSPTVIISPITSELKKNHLPTHVMLGKQFGLTAESMALLEQIRVIDRARLGKYIGTLSDEYMKSIDKAIGISLGLQDGR